MANMVLLTTSYTYRGDCMIDIMGFDQDGNVLEDITLEKLKEENVKWFWVDFNNPKEDEVKVLSDYFGFHHLTVEDCLQFLQRPKVDFYEDYCFFIFQSIIDEQVEEIDMYLGKNYVITFHYKEDILGIQEVRKELKSQKNRWEELNVYIGYLIVDEIVDQYFPIVHSLEDELDEFEDINSIKLSRQEIEKLYEIKSKLLKLRKTITSMRDLLYRMNNANHLKEVLGNHMYFVNIYDHLLKLTDMIEEDREIISDLQENYQAINANRMNTIMTVLTIITVIFSPLTFIAGIYGMNFLHMPELKWPYGYPYALGLMAVIGFSMYKWFKKKGWFDFDK